MAKKANAPAEDHVSGQSNQQLSRPAHALTYQQVEEELGANVLNGITAAEVQSRVEMFGRNDLGEGEGVQPVTIIIAQIANAMTMVCALSLVLARSRPTAGGRFGSARGRTHGNCEPSSNGRYLQVLILAMTVSYGFKSWIEGGVITFVILLNVIVGFFQEYSAEKTMDSLRSLSSPTGTVVRDGESMVVPSGEIVPGDLVEIKTGDTVPADVRYVRVPYASRIATSANPRDRAGAVEPRRSRADPPATDFAWRAPTHSQSSAIGWPRFPARGTNGLV